MANVLLDSPFFQSLADEHRQWLAAFDPQYLRNWEKNLLADEESALAEAGVRRCLVGAGVVVEPNEDLAGAARRPDFRCVVGDYKFCIEVTCIASEKVTDVTGLVDGATGFCNYSSLNNAVFAACRQKAEQCGNQDCPTLVVVATFHGRAAAVCFTRPHAEMLLTGETMLTWNMNMETVEKVGDVYQTTQLKSAAFFRPTRAADLGTARCSISGLVLCGLGCVPPAVIGILHPDPARPFDPSVLPAVDFGFVRYDRDENNFHVAWTHGDEE